jgi:hypothetical protein
MGETTNTIFWKMKKKEEPTNPDLAPGIGLDVDVIIDLITHEFRFPDRDWVTVKNRTTRQKVARQLLHKCLIDHLSYSQLEAGEITLQDRVTARHGKKTIEDTFWDDPQYGEKIKVVYNRCVEIKRGWFNNLKG